MTTMTNRKNTTEVIMNGKGEDCIRTYMKTLTADDRITARQLEHKLLEWCRMRRSCGWTLTEAGLAVTLDKLKRLADGDINQMLKIVNRTLKRKWNSFYPYIEDAAPSGAALIELEQRNEHNRQSSARGRLPQYDTQKVDDFSYLEF